MLKPEKNSPGTANIATKNKLSTNFFTGSYYVQTRLSNDTQGRIEYPLNFFYAIIIMYPEKTGILAASSLEISIKNTPHPTPHPTKV